jgi:hypothetical protein
MKTAKDIEAKLAEANDRIDQMIEKANRLRDKSPTVLSTGDDSGDKSQRTGSEYPRK